MLNYSLSYSVSVSSSLHRMPKMKWSLKHDTIFGRELLSWELWKYRSGTRERGNCSRKYAKFSITSKSLNFAFRKNL